MQLSDLEANVRIAYVNTVRSLINIHNPSQIANAWLNMLTTANLALQEANRFPDANLTLIKSFAFHARIQFNLNYIKHSLVPV